MPQAVELDGLVGAAHLALGLVATTGHGRRIVVQPELRDGQRRLLHEGRHGLAPVVVLLLVRLGDVDGRGRGRRQVRLALAVDVRVGRRLLRRRVQLLPRRVHELAAQRVERVAATVRYMHPTQLFVVEAKAPNIVRLLLCRNHGQ